MKYADRHELAEAVQMVYPSKPVPAEFWEECDDVQPKMPSKKTVSKIKLDFFYS